MVNYQGFSLFNDVKNPMIRAWNRNQTSLNVIKKGGMPMFKEYIKNFPQEDLAAIINIRKDIRTRGYTTVHKEIKRMVTNRG